MWVAPSDGTFTFDTAGSSFDTVLRLYADDCGTELACDDDGGPDLTSSITQSVSAGERLVIVVDAYSSYSEGSHSLSIRPNVGASCTLADGAPGAYSCETECVTDTRGDGSCDDAWDCFGRL